MRKVMIELSQEQKQAYDRYIKARDNIKRNRIRNADVVQTVDIAGMNHPLFEVNEPWLEYKEASEAWWKVEPAFRDEERMRMSRGDYGKQDSWSIKTGSRRDMVDDVQEMMAYGTFGSIDFFSGKDD
jgi:hypothetical protein